MVYNNDSTLVQPTGRPVGAIMDIPEPSGIAPLGSDPKKESAKDSIIEPLHVTTIDDTKLDRSLVGGLRYVTHDRVNAILESRARNQSASELFGKTVANLYYEAAGGFISSLGHAKEVIFEQNKEARLQEEAITNVLVELGHKYKEEGKLKNAVNYPPGYENKFQVTPFQGEDWKFWWAENLPSIGTTIGLMGLSAIPYGVGKATSASLRASGLNKYIQRAVLKNPKLMASLSGYGTAAYIGSGGLLQRGVESMMEGDQVYQELYNTYKDQLGEEKARELATGAFLDNYKANMALAVIDIPQQLVAFGGTKYLSRANKHLKRLSDRVPKGLGVGLSIAGEGVEEAYQYVSAEESKRKALKERGLEYDPKDFFERMHAYSLDPHFKTSAFMGLLGGAIFQGLGAGSQAIANKFYKKKNNVSQTLYEYIEAITTDVSQGMGNFGDKAEALFNSKAISLAEMGGTEIGHMAALADDLLKLSDEKLAEEIGTDVGSLHGVSMSAREVIKDRRNRLASIIESTQAISNGKKYKGMHAQDKRDLIHATVMKASVESQLKTQTEAVQKYESQIEGIISSLSEGGQSFAEVNRNIAGLKTELKLLEDPEFLSANKELTGEMVSEIKTKLQKSIDTLTGQQKTIEESLSVEEIESYNKAENEIMAISAVTDASGIYPAKHILSYRREQYINDINTIQSEEYLKKRDAERKKEESKKKKENDEAATKANKENIKREAQDRKAAKDQTEKDEAALAEEEQDRLNELLDIVKDDSADDSRIDEDGFQFLAGNLGKLTGENEVKAKDFLRRNYQRFPASVSVPQPTPDPNKNINIDNVQPKGVSNADTPKGKKELSAEASEHAVGIVETIVDEGPYTMSAHEITSFDDVLFDLEKGSSGSPLNKLIVEAALTMAYSSTPFRKDPSGKNRTLLNKYVKDFNQVIHFDLKEGDSIELRMDPSQIKNAHTQDLESIEEFPLSFYLVRDGESSRIASLRVLSSITEEKVAQEVGEITNNVEIQRDILMDIRGEVVPAFMKALEKDNYEFSFKGKVESTTMGHLNRIIAYKNSLGESVELKEGESTRMTDSLTKIRRVKGYEGFLIGDHLGRYLSERKSNVEVSNRNPAVAAGAPYIRVKTHRRDSKGNAETIALPIIPQKLGNVNSRFDLATTAKIATEVYLNSIIPGRKAFNDPYKEFIDAVSSTMGIDITSVQGIRKYLEYFLYLDSKFSIRSSSIQEKKANKDKGETFYFNVTPSGIDFQSTGSTKKSIHTNSPKNIISSLWGTGDLRNSTGNKLDLNSLFSNLKFNLRLKDANAKEDFPFVWYGREDPKGKLKMLSQRLSSYSVLAEEFHNVWYETIPVTVDGKTIHTLFDHPNINYSLEEVESTQPESPLEDIEETFSKLEDLFASEEFQALPNSQEIQNKLEDLFKNKEEVVLSKDESSYVSQGDTNEENPWSRVTEMITDKEFVPTTLLKSATNIGTALDGIVRDYFNSPKGALTWGSYKNSSGAHVINTEAEFNRFIKGLDRVRRRFELNGEFPISDEIRILLHKERIAGTTDIVTIDTKGKLRVYDTKSKRRSPNKVSGSSLADLTEPYRNPDGTESLETKLGIWTKQLNTYRRGIEETHGLEVVEMFIIPIEVSYSDKYEVDITHQATVGDLIPIQRGNISFEDGSFDFNFETLYETSGWIEIVPKSKSAISVEKKAWFETTEEGATVFTGYKQITVDPTEEGIPLSEEHNLTYDDVSEFLKDFPLEHPEAFLVDFKLSGEKRVKVIKTSYPKDGSSFTPTVKVNLALNHMSYDLKSQESPHKKEVEPQERTFEEKKARRIEHVQKELEKIQEIATYGNTFGEAMDNIELRAAQLSQEVRDREKEFGSEPIGNSRPFTKEELESDEGYIEAKRLRRLIDVEINTMYGLAYGFDSDISVVIQDLKQDLKDIEAKTERKTPPEDTKDDSKDDDYDPLDDLLDISKDYKTPKPSADEFEGAIRDDSNQEFIFSNGDRSSDQAIDALDDNPFILYDLDKVPPTETIPYTPKGKETQTYSVIGNKIYNKNGKEVFATKGADRNKIFANLAVQNKRAVVVTHKGAKYVVNRKSTIMSVATGKIMKWGEENGDRVSILEKAYDAMPVEETSTKPAETTEIVRIKLKDLNKGDKVTYHSYMSGHVPTEKIVAAVSKYGVKFQNDESWYNFNEYDSSDVAWFEKEISTSSPVKKQKAEPVKEKERIVSPKKADLNPPIVKKTEQEIIDSWKTDKEAALGLLGKPLKKGAVTKQISVYRNEGSGRPIRMGSTTIHQSVLEVQAVKVADIEGFSFYAFRDSHGNYTAFEETSGIPTGVSGRTQKTLKEELLRLLPTAKDWKGSIQNTNSALKEMNAELAQLKKEKAAPTKDENIPIVQKGVSMESPFSVSVTFKGKTYSFQVSKDLDQVINRDTQEVLTEGALFNMAVFKTRKVRHRIVTWKGVKTLVTEKGEAFYLEEGMYMHEIQDPVTKATLFKATDFAKRSVAVKTEVPSKMPYSKSTPMIQGVLAEYDVYKERTNRYRVYLDGVLIKDPRIITLAVLESSFVDYVAVKMGPYSYAVTSNDYVIRLSNDKYGGAGDRVSSSDNLFKSILEKATNVRKQTLKINSKISAKDVDNMLNDKEDNC